MKKMISNIKTLAALLMVGAAFTACSNDDEITAEQPVQPTEPQVYTMVIKASKGDDAMTRALKPGFNSETGKNTIDFYWSGNEKIDVGQMGNSGYYVKIGTATAAPSATGETTITATFNSAPNPASDIQFFLCGGNQDYTGQVGLLTGENSISEKYDYFEATLSPGKYTVDGYDITPSVGITFNQSINSIVKFINIGRFSYEKGHERLIEAFEIVRDLYDNARLIIIGGYGPIYNEVLERAQSSKFASDIVVIKSLSNVFPVLTKCSAFVLSSYYEGLPVTIMEALVLGKTVISTDIVGPRAFLSHGYGHLVQESPEAIAEGMTKFIEGTLPPARFFDAEEFNRNAIREFESLFD